MPGRGTLIVILNYNGQAWLRPCLESIRRHTDLSQARVVVADNASPDGSLAIVEREFPWAEAVQNGANLGMAKGNNAILATREADRYVLLNPDTEVGPGWLEALHAEADAAPDVGIVGGKLLFPDGRIQHAGGIVDAAGPRHLGYLADAQGHEEAADVDYVTFACALITREVVERIGYLDEAYTPFYYEDSDYCLRARAAGFRVRYTPRCVVVHHENAATSKHPSAARIAIAERNRLQFKLVHFPARWWLRSAPAELRTLAGHTVRGNLRPFARAVATNVQERRRLRERRRSRAAFVPSAFSPADRHDPEAARKQPR